MQVGVLCFMLKAVKLRIVCKKVTKVRNLDLSPCSGLSTQEFVNKLFWLSNASLVASRASSRRPSISSMQGEDIDFGWLAWRDSRRSESRRSSVVSISGEDHGLPSLGKWTKVLAATRRRKFDRFENLFLSISILIILEMKKILSEEVMKMFTSKQEELLELSKSQGKLLIT